MTPFDLLERNITAEGQRPNVRPWTRNFEGDLARRMTKVGPRPRVLVDVSTSYRWRGKHAVGIVRTEREIASRLLRDQSIDVIAVVFHDGSFRAIEPEFALSLLEAVDAVPANDTAPSQPARRSWRWVLWSLANVTARSLVSRRARKELRWSWRHPRKAVRNLRYPPAASAAGCSEKVPELSLIVHPTVDDILFLCGLGWDVIDCRAVARLRSSTGLKLVSVLYDLIPILHPELVADPSSDFFLNYFLHMADMSDRVLCISECSRRDFLAFCNAEGRKAPTTSVLYLGSNIPSAPDASELEHIGIADTLRRRHFALAVGTFEIRKNYALLIDLWRELVEDPSFDMNLVIVGMPGWCVQDTIARLEASPLYGKRVFWLKCLSDAGVSWLYENCKVFLFPSLYEGWGLPVIEAMQHGRRAIISSRGATPEAGMGIATVIDPDDRDRWRDAIMHAARNASQPGQVNVALPTWDQAAKSAKDVLLSLSLESVAR